MSDRDRASPTLMESGLKTLIGGRDSNYPLISGTNGKSYIEAKVQKATIGFFPGTEGLRMRTKFAPVFFSSQSHPSGAGRVWCLTWAPVAYTCVVVDMVVVGATSSICDGLMDITVD